jgi:hypothetical protein
MNVPAELAKQVVDSLKATPFLLALLVINMVVLGGFAYTLHQVAHSIERRDNILAKCLDR